MVSPLPLAAAVTGAGAGRTENSDRYGIFPRQGVFVVVAGVGQPSASGLVAQMAVDALREHFEVPSDDPAHPYRKPGASRLVAGLRLAHQRIAERRCGAGATVAALSIEEDGVLVTHAGDCRVYLVADGGVEQLTEDHTLHAELRRACPDITPAELAQLPARVNTRILGMDKTFDFTVQTFPLRRGERYLLCTRGLHDSVPPDEIREAVHAGADLDATVRDLFGRARRHGAAADVTCVLVRPVP